MRAPGYVFLMYILWYGGTYPRRNPSEITRNTTVRLRMLSTSFRSLPAPQSASKYYVTVTFRRQMGISKIREVQTDR
ncbi:hypothetical protein OF83DRAFT_1140711 [Amylostereum chailletii]|nr:hypothetical protein OF83DRAFT_1140711 [Amylostereum chailletii]